MGTIPHLIHLRLNKNIEELKNLTLKEIKIFHLYIGSIEIINWISSPSRLLLQVSYH